jgi:ubiquinol-cytochrome c reductase iron-sulfur subunit
MSELATTAPASSDGEQPRRDFLHLTTGTIAAIGAGLAVWPLIDSLNPAADTREAASVEVDLAPIEIGQRIVVKWRGQPVFIAHRTLEEIARAKADDSDPRLIDPTKDGDRVQNPEWLVVVGICTHLGCVPVGQQPETPRGDWGGWYCPCHGSHYDTSGRVRKGPAPRNLDVPPYRFLADGRVEIG